jgi:curved DNA-binding protein CbpA
MLQVKLSYRKAMLVVHPDRCATLPPETRFIAKRIFEAINEAYQDFLKKEGLS